VTTGEGGAVTTDVVQLADEVRRLRHHGIAPAGEFEIEEPGFNDRLPDVLCAVGIPQLRRLPELLAGRERVAALYSARLDGVAGLPAADDGDTHGWQAYVVSVDRRDEVLAALRAEEIEAQIGTYALHRLRAYRDQGPFPGADEAFERALALPFHSRLTERDVDRVGDALERALGRRP
jgi:dTDP-4-amino-4,6-dideoxygalactose transaminase